MSVAGTARWLLTPVNGPRHRVTAIQRVPAAGGLPTQVCLVLSALCAAMPGLRAGEPPSVIPAASWETCPPGEAGFDAAKLEEFGRAVGGDGVVIRSGDLVHTWGRPDRRGDWASAAKPVISTLLLFAVDEGRLKSVDEPIRPWVQKRWPGKDLREKDRAITFRHLADMTSGYARGEAPGTHWAYNDVAISLYRHVMEEVLGESLNAALHARLRPLGFEDGDVFGSRGGGGVAASPRDLARIGWFWLHKGRWNGEPLLSGTLFDEHMRPDVPRNLPRTRLAGEDYLDVGTYGGGTDQEFAGQGVYGFNWWFNTRLAERDELLFPHLPEDAIAAIGHRGKEVLLVIPSLRIVVAARGDWGGVRLDKTRLLMAAVVDETPGRTARDVGEFAKWAGIEVAFSGPESRAAGDPNPFGVALDVVFTSPVGTSFTVPGFYDGDGKGGLDGNVWKVRFSADAPGQWSFRSRSEHDLLDDQRGRFTVVEPPADAPDFYRWGRLEAVGTPENQVRYLKFRDGPYWLKAGCDDPENFLGKYRNYDTPEKRRAAVDYLAARGINSMYLMTHNIDGDDKDVWPWLGATARAAKANGGSDARFDLARLDEWRALFEHMQRRGVVVYLVLEDDSAWKGYDHRRYYRELVARFGDLPAVVFNFGEEHNENYRLAEALDHLRLLAELDPYDHPRGIHNVNTPNDAYIDAPWIDFTAIQTGSPNRAPEPLLHNQRAIDWLERCRARGRRVLVIGFDEGRPELDRRAWWSAYLGGGVWEAHVLPPYDRPMSAWEPVWTELGGTRAFLESLAFHEMEPRNDLVVAGQAFCLARPGAAYALYLPAGGTATLDLERGAEYLVEWWNPANGSGGTFQNRQATGGGRQELAAPGEGDWAARIVKR